MRCYLKYNLNLNTKVAETIVINKEMYLAVPTRRNMQMWFGQGRGIHISKIASQSFPLSWALKSLELCHVCGLDLLTIDVIRTRQKWLYLWCERLT